MNTSDIMMRKQLADCGYHLINVPIDVSNGHALVAVNANKCITCIDTATHQVYNIPQDSLHSFQAAANQQCTYSNDNTYNNTTNFAHHAQQVTRAAAPLPRNNTPMYSFGGLNIHASSDSGILRCPSNNGNTTMARGLVPYSTHPDAMDVDSHMSSSNNANNSVQSSHYRVMKPQHTSGGIHLLTPRDFILEQAPHTPSYFDADFSFYDSLYMSLQEDATLSGTNPCDRYLYDRRDARMRMYLDAAIANQGCGCERSPLERYLANNKTTLAAIALRATLSDEAKRKVYQPTDARAVQRELQKLQSQMNEGAKILQQLGQNQRPDSLNPWSSHNEGVDGMAFGDDQIM